MSDGMWLAQYGKNRLAGEPSSSMQGWECPKCGSVNSPWVMQCPCSKKRFTSASSEPNPYLPDPGVSFPIIHQTYVSCPKCGQLVEQTEFGHHWCQSLPTGTGV